MPGQLKSRSRPLEYPHIVLVSATTAELFRSSKTAPAFLQFVTKGDRHLTVQTLRLERGHQRVPVPAQPRTIRPKLECVLDRLAVSDKRRLTPKHRLAVLDADYAALESSGCRAEGARLPVQRPLAGENPASAARSLSLRLQKEACRDEGVARHRCPPRNGHLIPGNKRDDTIGDFEVAMIVS
jgi:hypothetical protein